MTKLDCNQVGHLEFLGASENLAPPAGAKFYTISDGTYSFYC